MDLPAPVAAQIKPPDPNQAINTLSAILGIKQQRQALQTGQYLQQAEAAKASQEQQKNAEYQAAQNLVRNSLSQGKYRKDDGSLDRIALSDAISSVAPTYGQDIANQLVTGANEQVENQRGLQTLNKEQQAQLADRLTSLSQKPDLSRDDILKDIDAARELNPSKSYGRMLTYFTSRVPVNGSPQDYQKFIQQAQSAMSGQLQNAPGTVDVGGQIQPTEINRFTGVQTPAGVPFNKTLAPTERPEYKGEVGSVAIDVERANTISAAANAAPGAIRLSQEIDSLADQIHSGKISKAFSSAASAIGIDPVTYARQLLNKDLGQLKTIASSGASTDAKMGTILSGYPDDTSATPTIHTAMDYIRGSFRQSLARGQNLEDYQKKHGGVAGFQHSDNVLAQSTDPLMHEYLSLSPSERAGFYTRNFRTAAEAQAFKNKVKGVQHATGQ